MNITQQAAHFGVARRCVRNLVELVNGELNNLGGLHDERVDLAPFEAFMIVHKLPKIWTGGGGGLKEQTPHASESHRQHPLHEHMALPC